jgi:molybdopterin-guanine dinucleotide biosynthesis protein A
LIFGYALAYLLFMNSDVCAVILAGGQSRRMGVNKALLEIGDKPIIRVLIDRILPVTDRILISSNDTQSYGFLDYPVIPDHFPGNGPLAGFHSAMLYNTCSLYIMLACDLPNLKTTLLQSLISLAEGFDAAVPRTGDCIIHPLCAVYRRTSLMTASQYGGLTPKKASLKIPIWLISTLQRTYKSSEFHPRTNQATDSICSSPEAFDPRYIVILLGS